MGVEEGLERLRRGIDRLNEEIVAMLAMRVSLAVEIGRIKRRSGRPIVDPEREARMYDAVRGLARRCGLDEEGVKRIFEEIVKLCTEAQLRDTG